ncbi:MAG: phage terminase large subunit [Clostridium sp.]
MPPQHGKSQCVTETLPSYYLGKFPDKRVIEVSYGDDLARRFGRKNKDKIIDYGKELFDISLSKSSDVDLEIETHKGSMISKGIMAGLTGNPGDLIIIDDPVKNRQEAMSETYRDRVWEEFINSIYTRLSANGIIIVIMTRWHEDDLAGRLLQHMPDKCKEINIPLEAMENDILGRKVGDSLFPEIGKDNDWLQDFKKVYQTKEGSQSWNALMQGQPTSGTGNMLKRDWWKYYTVLPKLAKVVMSVDATFKDSDTSDYVAISVWGKINADMYLIDFINERMDFPTTTQAIVNMKHKHMNISHIYIEDKANGSAIISVLAYKINGIIPVTPRESKIARVSAISGSIEAGNVYLPEGKQFSYDLVDQAASFPNGKHDDMVDSMSQAINKLLYSYAEIPGVRETEYEYMNPAERQDYELREFTGGEVNREMFKWDIF